MYINNEKKFIFIHVPKTAGSSIHIFFKDVFNVADRSDPLPDIHHQSVGSILDKDPIYKDYFKFAVVRNPYDRFLSGYRDFSQNKHSSRASHPYHIEDGCTFERFCLDFSDSVWSKDIHFRPQHELLTVGDEVKVDKIIRFENLKDDLQEVFDLLGLPMHVFNNSPKHRYTNKTSNHYAQLYSDRSKEAIASFFEKDLKIFDYEF
tara:strand:+ start:171 stop:785 length:615 start_codon:yes stop_codon:yes gene_type:complete